MSHIGVDRVSEVDRSRAAGQHDDAAQRRKRVDLFGIQIHFEGGHELAGIAHFALPFDKLPQPCDALIVRRQTAPAFLVFPVRRDAFFGDPVHLFRPNLHLERESRWGP